MYEIYFNKHHNTLIARLFIQLVFINIAEIITTSLNGGYDNLWLINIHLKHIHTLMIISATF